MKLEPKTTWRFELSSEEVRLVISALRAYEGGDSETNSKAYNMANEMFEVKTKVLNSMLKNSQKNMENLLKEPPSPDDIPF